MQLTNKFDLVCAGVVDVDTANNRVLVCNEFTNNKPYTCTPYYDKQIGVYRINLTKKRCKSAPTAVYPRLVYCWTHPTITLTPGTLVIPKQPYTGDINVDIINGDTLQLTNRRGGTRNKHRMKVLS